MAEGARATGLVLAAGGSRRLGQPKQLLSYGDGTLLEHVLGVARASGLDQVVCALGEASAEIRRTVDLRGVDVVDNPDYGAGCSSSIAAALRAVDPRADVLVLLLGDQPGVTPATVAALLCGRGDAPVAVCRYADGRGHPLAFARTLFGALGALHGDKAVWKLLDRHAAELVEVPVSGPVPRDVDTEENYAAVLAEAAAGAAAASISRSRSSGTPSGSTRSIASAPASSQARTARGASS
jgi:molybdenum cofactor cytidylyltransferase